MIPLQVEVVAYAVPFRQLVVTGRATYRERRGWWVRVTDPDGAWGIGEVAPLPAFGTEELSDAARALDTLAITSFPVDEALEERPGWSMAPVDVSLLPATRSGLELAVWDWRARRHGVCVAELFSATPVGRVPVQRMLSEPDPMRLAGQASVAIASGYRTLKLKVGGRTWEADRERVRAVREAIGGFATLRLDANGAWSMEEAHRALEDLAQESIDLMEQPVLNPTGSDWQALARHGVPLAADESAASVAGAEAALRSGGVRALVLKPSVLGGLGTAWELAMEARLAGVRVVMTSTLERVIGVAGALHLAAALGGREPCGLATLDLFEPPDGGLIVEHGMLHLPLGPGLGVPWPGGDR